MGYIHHYGGGKSLGNREFDEPREESFSLGEGANQQTEKKETKSKLAFASSTLLPLNEEHENCKREVVYFIDRLVIVFNPETRK